MNDITRTSNQSAEQLLEAYDAAWIEDQQIGMSPSGTVTIGIITRAKERFNTARAAVLVAMRPAHEPPDVPSVEPIARVINNNQPGWTNIVETAPNVTLDVGAPLYDRAAIMRLAAALAGAIHRQSEPPAESHSADHLQRFTDWLVKEMPAGTVIGDPAWWARKLLAGACVFADEMPPDTDGARYRFLRQPGNAIVYARDPHAWGHNTPGHIRYGTPEQLDAAIDAAIGASVTKHCARCDDWPDEAAPRRSCTCATCVAQRALAETSGDRNE